MSTNAVKNALVRAYPETSAKDWKRRSKKKENGAEHRVFEHPDVGEVLTIEDMGRISIPNATEFSAAPPKPDDFTPPRMSDDIAKPVDFGEILNPDEIKSGDRARVRDGEVYYSYTDYAGGRVFNPQKNDGEEFTILGMVGVADFLSLASAAALRPIVEEMYRCDARAFDRNEDAAIKGVKTASRDDLVGECSYVLHWMREKNPRPSTRSFEFQKSDLLKDLIEKARVEVVENYGENPQFVLWGNPHQRRAALLSDVEKTKDKSQVRIKAAPKKKEQKITKRRLMVENSRWRFTADTVIEMWVRNPLIDDLIQKREAIAIKERNSTQIISGQIHVFAGGGRSLTAEEKAQVDAIQKQINEAPNQVKINAGTVKEGTEITIVGKLAAGYSMYGSRETNGLMVPVKIDKGTIENSKIKLSGWDSGIPFKQIEKNIEPLHIPEAIMWVMRDTVTGDFFGGWQTKNGYQTNEPKMSSTFSGAKKYKTSAAAKASVRDFTGYNAGLDDEGGSDYWLGIGEDTKKMDLPDTWELVAIDKTTNEEKKVEDLQDWYAGLMRLRVLTQGHGSAVRGVYKKAEGKGFESILLFSSRDEDGNPLPFEELDWPNEEGKALVKKIDASVKNFTKKPIRVRAAASIAFGCMLEDAYLAKMSFSAPDVQVKIFDIETLEEVVENAG